MSNDTLVRFQHYSWWNDSLNGRAMAYKPSKKSILFYYVWVAEWPNAMDCKSVKPWVQISPQIPNNAWLVKWYNVTLPTLRQGFDSLTPHQNLCPFSPIWYEAFLSKGKSCRFESDKGYQLTEPWCNGSTRRKVIPTGIQYSSQIHSIHKDEIGVRIPGAPPNNSSLFQR